MFSKLSTPLKVGLTCAVLGILLTLIGVVRGNVPLQPANIAVALLIGGGFWFLVSWAVTSAAVDVENDITTAQDLVVQDLVAQDLSDTEPVE